MSKPGGSRSNRRPYRAFDTRCRDEIRLIGAELGDVIELFGGADAFECVEEIRQLARARRHGSESAGQRLRERIAGLDEGELDIVINAMSCFLDLANLAEDRQRVRVLRERRRDAYPKPSPESIGAALKQLRQEGLDGDEVARLTSELEIELVLTAHPTEAKRHTSRLTLARLRDDLKELERSDLLPSEVDTLRARLRAHMACFWETETLRAERPRVLDEVRRALRVADTLWSVVPEIARDVREALESYADAPAEIPRTVLRFGSWIGGDRDGHPFVTAEVTRRTLELHRQEALSRHLEECRRLLEILSLSARRHKVDQRVFDALGAALDRWPQCRERVERWSVHEVYRRWLAVVRFRLEQTARSALGAPPAEGAYTESRELVEDLELVADSLAASGHEELVAGEVMDWVSRAATFGFHLYRLDVRYHARVLHEVVDELSRHLGLDRSALEGSEADRQAFLLREVTGSATLPPLDSLSTAARDLIELFAVIRSAREAYGPECIGTLIVSGTSAPSDLLALLWLDRVTLLHPEGGRGSLPLPLVPLFETIRDLENSGDVLHGLLSIPEYRRHVDGAGGRQICMLGYSDSTKDGGYLCSAWKLHQAGRELSRVGDRHGVELVYFHGRGGALGRGGGPAARGILSLPQVSFRGRMRITEQGEVLAERYDDPEIAHRHLEQVIWASLLLRSGRRESEPTEAWSRLMEKMATVSFRAYRDLVEGEEFLQYFREATPIEVIENLPIGSRPSRRRAGQSLDQLRAIPYTFAWTQCRHLLTALFGLGAALRSLSAEETKLLREMVQLWPFARSTMDNAELAIAKFDRAMGREYSSLVTDAAVQSHVWGTIEKDYEEARKGTLAVLEREELLESIPWLRRSITYRNRYVDALNLAQIELLRRRRALQSEGVESPDLRRLRALLRLSVSGVAAGMRSTG